MTDSRQQLVGTWRLADWYMDGGSGERIHPFGPDAIGYLVYTASGQVSATLQEPGRPDLDTPPVEVAVLKHQLGSGDTGDLAPDRIPILGRYFQAAAGYMAYCGTFTVHGDTVVHRIETSLYPEWIGADLERQFSLDGDTLRLHGDAGGFVQHLVWQRVEHPEPSSAG